MDIESRHREALRLYSAGEIEAVEQRCLAELHAARLPGFLHLLALCRLAQGRHSEAIPALQEALQMLPSEPLLLHDLGRAYSGIGDWPKAAQAYIKAIDVDPMRATNYLYLGPIYEQVGDLDSAERAYRRALELDPKLATASASLAAMHEKANRLEEAGRLVATALELDPANVVANLTQAQLDQRKGAHAEAADRLARLLTQPLSPWNHAIAAGRLGTAYDNLGRYDEAFAAFVDGKRALLREDLANDSSGLYSSASSARVARHLTPLMTDVPAAAPGQAPVFLVGFPRSGTTLLDQILSSHPRIAVLEERGVLLPALQEFAGDEAGIARLMSLDAAGRDARKQRYLQLAGQALGRPLEGRLLVDKLPLYTLFMPVIRRLFPDARFIFAVRDPRDVVLSCFMHAFGLNEAMRHFLTLEGSADFYAAVMDVGIAAIEKMPDQALRLDYEALVDDPEAQGRRLCAFLGVEWEPGMLRFYDTAKKRRINTPSYHQVVQPVYASARGRWRRYQTQLAPVLGRLRPYVEYFGYPPDTTA
ncbi:MAG TPA: sulfotransferase [Gammaproteobacteria bacterium]|nr:sulfotransferase [Gammaproteobacteria bacterium]